MLNSTRKKLNFSSTKGWLTDKDKTKPYPW
jgi:hypothetical protein